MTNIAANICFGVWLPIALLFGGVYFSRGQYHVAAWWLFGGFVAAGLGTTLYVQAWLTDREERATASTAEPVGRETEIRPYIDVLNPVLSPLAVGQTPIVRVTIKNTGKTPAVDVIIGSRVQIGDFPLFADTKAVFMTAWRSSNRSVESNCGIHRH